MIIFLDIDGVMVPAKGWIPPNLLGDGFYEFSEEAVSALNELLKYGENEDYYYDFITIVLITSHRNRYTQDEWIKIFYRRGINVGKSLLVINPKEFKSKIDLIVTFFNGTEALSLREEFYIIDDDPRLNDLPIHLKSQFIQTKPFIGLTSKDLPFNNNKTLEQN